MTGRWDRPAGEEQEPRDAGVGLVETLVAMALFGILGSLLLGLAVSTGQVTGEVRTLAGINEESRLAMERLSRELRQAGAVTAVTLPPAAGGETAITFWTDFDGDNVQDLNAADPEVLTYRWNPANDELSLTANDATGTAVTRPVLAARVSRFDLELRSSDWEADACSPLAGPCDGTTWQELDAVTAGGNGNGQPDGDELERLDLVGVTLTVLDGPRAQTYTTRVDLRNRS